MGREVRRVPSGWEHPRRRGKHNERCVPLFDKYNERVKEWDEGHKLWEEGKHPHQELIGDNFEEWDGPRPKLINMDDPSSWETGQYMPDFPQEQRTHIQLYETTTEGTPISPVFATVDDLAVYASKHCTTFAHFTATEEEWRSWLSGPTGPSS